MARKLLHIGCMFPILPKTLAVDAVLNGTNDEWIRYASNNWIIWTEKSAGEITKVVRGAYGTEDQLLVVNLDAQEKDGSLPKWVWDWIDSKRNVDTRTLAEILGQSGIGANLGLGGGIGRTGLVDAFRRK